MAGDLGQAADRYDPVAANGDCFGVGVIGYAREYFGIEQHACGLVGPLAP